MADQKYQCNSINWGIALPKVRRFMLRSVLGNIALIVTSIILSEYINKNFIDKMKRDEYLGFIYCSLQESYYDLVRDYKGHQKSIEETGKLLRWILDSTSIKKDSLQWDYVNSDFQFYPNYSGYESLKFSGLNLLDISDTLDQMIILLFELDYKRIESLGRESSATRNIRHIWENDFRRYFTISLNEKRLFTGMEGNAFGDGKYSRLRSRLKRDDAQTLTEIFNLIILSKEIRDHKMHYYENVITTTEKVMKGIEQELDIKSIDHFCMDRNKLL